VDKINYNQDKQKVEKKLNLHNTYRVKDTVNVLPCKICGKMIKGKINQHMALHKREENQSYKT
jgi:hypothetical protein